MTKIAVCLVWDDGYQSLADVTWTQNKKLYCDYWGYPYHIRTSGFKYTPAYEKIKLVLDTLNEHPEYDWVYWVDTDTLITNFYIKLESFVDDRYNIVIAKDINGINSGSMMLKNTPETRAYLEYIWSLGPKYKNHCLWEQQAMIETMPEHEHLFKFVPQKTFNSFLYKQLYWHTYGSSIDQTGNDGQWAPGDFLLHVPGTGLPKKDILEKFMGLVRHIVV